MAYTPQHSPIKVSASQSQEDLKTYEVIDDPLREEEDGHMSDEMPPSSIHAKSPPVTQIKISESQAEHHQMEVDDAPDPTPAADPRRQQNRTPEPIKGRSQRASVQPSPSTPGRLEPFDWDEFESRYQRALAEADQKESELLEEFEHLVKACTSIFVLNVYMLTAIEVFQGLGLGIFQSR